MIKKSEIGDFVLSISSPSDFINIAYQQVQYYSYKIGNINQTKIHKMSIARETSLTDFTFIKKLGEGAFGQVHLVKRKATGQNYALKKVRLRGMKEKDKNNALNEIRILASINHDSIIKFKAAFFDEATSNLCIVMEHANGGDLSKLIQHYKRMNRKIPQTEIWKALMEICKGLQSLHEKNILHRDLKSANIFISDGTYKLGDLNVSKVLKKGLAETQAGTPFYASPEVWQDFPYDLKSDIWSLGCVLYQMAAQEPPFKANDLNTLYKKVIAGKFKPIPSNYSKQLNDTISSLLKIKPSERPNASFLLKSKLIQEKLGSTSQSRSEEKQNYLNGGLLETIRYNPLDPKSLNMVLPHSSYEKEERNLSLRNKVRTQSVSEIGNFTTDRTHSEKKIRVRSRQQTEGARYKKNQSYMRRQSDNLLPSIPHKRAILPPISSPYKRQQTSRNPQNRLVRGHQRILGM